MEIFRRTPKPKMPRTEANIRPSLFKSSQEILEARASQLKWLRTTLEQHILHTNNQLGKLVSQVEKGTVPAGWRPNGKLMRRLQFTINAIEQREASIHKELAELDKVIAQKRRRLSKLKPRQRDYLAQIEGTYNIELSHLRAFQHFKQKYLHLLELGQVARTQTTSAPVSRSRPQKRR